MPEINGHVRLSKKLSRSEANIYELVTMTSMSYKEIGVELCISEQTVKSHLTRICNKLGFSSRVELMLDYWQNKHGVKK